MLSSQSSTLSMLDTTEDDVRQGLDFSRHEQHHEDGQDGHDGEGPFFGLPFASLEECAMMDDKGLCDVVMSLAKNGTGEQMQHLLKRADADTVERVLLNNADDSGRHPIHVACFNDNVEVVDLLLTVQPQFLEACDNDALRGAQPLHYACWGGAECVVELLFERGCAMTNTDSVGNTALLYAVFGGHLQLVQRLVEKGCLLSDQNNKGHTAVIQAACGGHTRTIEYLINTCGRQVLKQSDSAGNTALLFAAWGGHLDLVKWLLLNGSTLDEVSDSGHNALLSAANSGALQVVQWLVEEMGADIRDTNMNKDNCLLLAAYGGHKDLLMYLLRNGADIDEVNEDGLDPLLSACNGGNKEMVEFLLGLGCSLNTTTDNGYTPLILAACGGYLQLVQWLAVHGCCVDARTSEGDSALLLSCYCGHADIVRWCIEEGHGAIDERNNAGLTPLISAANGGHADVVEYLITHGACVHDEDNDGYTAYLLAARRGHTNCVKMLALYGADQYVCVSHHGLDALTLTQENTDLNRWVQATQSLTPLHIAILLQREDLVSKYLQSGFDPRCLTLQSTGPTPLELASDRKACALFNQQAHNASTTYANINGQRHNNDDVVEIAATPTPSLSAIVCSAAHLWRPVNHHLFGPHTRQNIERIFYTAKLLHAAGNLPLLPLELWEHIAAMLGRGREDHEAAMFGIMTCLCDK
eukprot:m.61004 g.61004  ORF g.61004 m.61004 type:complete len:697 (-) comp11373_c0_seq1:1729-3819(-)